MKTCIHLNTEDSDESIFHHLVDEDIKTKVGETFEYSDKYYHQLGRKAKEEFDKSGLKIGKYNVVATYLEPTLNGTEKYMFIRPLLE